MSRESHTTPPAEPPPTAVENPRLAAFSPRALVDLLFNVARPKLGRADLLMIVSGGAEFAENAAGHAAEVVEGLGCLVAHDAENAPNSAGNFQDGESVAPLLWHLQAHFQALEGAAAAVGWAASELATRDAVR